MSLGIVQIVVLLVALQRLAEVAYAQRNTRCLLAEGGKEHGARHYPLIVGLHAAWLAAIFFVVPADAPVFWPLLGLYLLLQGARVWTIASLGRYWTTRIVTMADAPLVRRGPYRFMRHPNYAVVALEIPLLPLALGAWELALGFGVANLVILAYRIRVEDSVLAARTG
jgi:methyltransferase